MDLIKRVYRNALYTFKGLYSSVSVVTFILFKVMNPVLQVLFFSLVAAHAYGRDNIMPYIIGNSFVLCSSNAFFGAGATLIAERSMGTLKNIIAAPCNKFEVFTSKGLFHIIEGLFTVIIGFITGIVFLNLKFSVSYIPVMLLIILVSMFSACSMGLLIGSIGLLTRDINLLLNMAAMSLMALCGVNFPVERLPIALRYLSNILPLTHGLKGARVLMEGGGSSTIYSLIITELVIGVAYCIIAYITFSIMERMAKIKSTIDIY